MLAYVSQFTIGLYAISPYGSGIFVSLASPLLILSTSYLAYKRGLEQLARWANGTSLDISVWKFINFILTIFLVLEDSCS
jgi:hypothetical protein